MSEADDEDMAERLCEAAVPDAVEGALVKPAGVAAIFGAAPELPEDSLLFRTLAAEVDEEEDLGARGIREYGDRSREEREEAARFWAGLSDEDRERVWRHGVAICMPDANGSMRHNVAMLAIEWAKDRTPAGDLLFSLASARALLASTERLAPDVSADDARVDLWVELREACDAFEQLQTDNANLRGAVEMLNINAAEREVEIERLESLLAAQERSATDQDAEIERLTKDRDAEVSKMWRLERDIGIYIGDPVEPLADRILRVHHVALDLQRAARAKAETLARWKRRAGKAEQRIAVLTEERDGLTLRLGAKIKGQVRRKAKRTKGGR